MLKIEKSEENAIISGQKDANGILQSAQIILFGFEVSKQAFFATTNTGCERTRAPEIIRGGDYTQSVDIYSAGVIYYELVTGKNNQDRNSTIIDRQSEQSRKLTQWMLNFDPKGRPTAVELHRIFSEMVRSQPNIKIINVEPSTSIPVQAQQKKPIKDNVPISSTQGLTYNQTQIILPTQSNSEWNQKDQQKKQSMPQQSVTFEEEEDPEPFSTPNPQTSKIANAEVAEVAEVAEIDEDPIIRRRKVKLIQQHFKEDLNQTQRYESTSTTFPQPKIQLDHQNGLPPQRTTLTQEYAQYQAIKKKIDQLDHLRLCYNQLTNLEVPTKENGQSLYRFIIAKNEYFANMLSKVFFKDQRLQEAIQREQLKIQNMLDNQKSQKQFSELFLGDRRIQIWEPEPSHSLIEWLYGKLTHLAKDETKHLKGLQVTLYDRKIRAIIILIVVLIDLGQITAPQEWIEMLELEITTSQKLDLRLIIYSIILKQGIISDSMQKWLNEQKLGSL